MTRVTCAVSRKKRVKRLLKSTKGFFGDRKNHQKLARSIVMKSWASSYIDRKRKKGEFRSLWIQRLNAGCRCHGISYSKFMNGLRKANVFLDRKILSNLMFESPDVFKVIVDTAKLALREEHRREN